MLLGIGHDARQNFILFTDRVIKKYDLNMIVSGPGHGGRRSWATFILRALIAVYPDISQDRPGCKLFVQFRFRRNSQPRVAGNSRLDPRRRRTGLLVESFLRSGVR